MIPEPLTPFDEITSGVRMVSPLQTMFAWAEETLIASRPEGFEVEEIGRMAFERLPESEKKTAFDELLYAYWEAVGADNETWARHAAGGER
jgi:hypothetical protein